MDKLESFNYYIEKTIKDNWNRDALTDYQGITLQYRDVARKIEKLHILFANSRIQKGDRIAISGRNSAHWAVAFFATLTYGAVAVPILHEFNAEQIHNIVNHSEAKLLFVGDVVVKTIVAEEMPNLEGIINLPDFSIHSQRSEKLVYAREYLNELFGKKYPKAFRVEDIEYHHDQPNELAIINYTSGTTGFSKGVMLPYRAILSNVEYCIKMIGKPVKQDSNVLSILPMAHMYGMVVEFLFPFCHGCHIYYLTRLPSPSLIAQALADVKPSVVVSVPLVVEKIIKKHIFPKTQNNTVKLLLSMPVISKRVKQRICEQVLKAFGGNAYEVIVGGAALNQEVEQFLHSIGFPITVGYGSTECAPLITFCDYKDFLPGSCGFVVDNMEMRVLSPDPKQKAGEVIARGKNVMLGYFKNEEATRQALDDDGWYHTGDLGTISADGHLSLKGRIKNMLLGANGQNVYPEEIEDKLNSMALVGESIIVQRGDKLVALVHPDYDEVKEMGFTKQDLVNVMEQNRQELNSSMPAYCKLSAITIHEEEFAKTAKKSIKRYLYK